MRQTDAQLQTILLKDIEEDEDLEVIEEEEDEDAPSPLVR